MNKLTLTLISSVVLLVAGCTTLPDGTRTVDQRIASATKIAAYIGTAKALQEEPTWRPYFEHAHTELIRLANDQDLDWIDVMAIVNSLPVQELKSDEATLYLSATTMLLEEFGDEVVNLNDVQKLRPITLALAEGLQLGLNSTP